MKKRVPLSIVMLTIILCKAEAQTLTIDPVMAGAIGAASITENAAYDKIKEKQKTIEVLQTTTVATVKMINDWHKKFYNGLIQVSTTVKNAYQLIECAEILNDIVQIENDMLTAAKDNPLALAFALKTQKEMVVKAITYYNEIKTLILKENDDRLLMDAGQRTDLLNNVCDNLRCLRALAWTSKAKVKLVVMNGILQSLNPFSNIVNNDAKIVKDILKSWKR